MCPEKIQAEIQSLTREINEHEQKHDYLRKITRAEISIDYINRWG